MSTLALAVREARYTMRAFWRNPAAAFFTIVFPLMFLVIFNVLFGNQRITISGHSTTTSTFYVPGITTMSIVGACFTNLAISVTGARDQGLLKRVRGTPLPSWAFLCGRIVHSMLLALGLSAVVAVAGALVYGVDVPWSKLPVIVVVVAIGGGCFCALALAVTAVIPNEESSPAVVNGISLPLLFLSNVFVRLNKPPRWIDVFGKIFPVRHLSEALQAAFNPFVSRWDWRPADLLVMALWAIAGGVLAVRFFSWEPRR